MDSEFTEIFTLWSGPNAPSSDTKTQLEEWAKIEVKRPYTAGWVAPEYPYDSLANPDLNESALRTVIV